ncbi:MAG: cell envelope biogenesis protein TolA [Sphingobium sp.]
MERAEKIGLGIASAAHVLLFAALSSNWVTPKRINLNNKPIEVSIADEVALRSTAPKLAPEPPPPTPGDVEGPPEQAAPAPSESIAQPEPAPPPPTPAPRPKAAEKPAPKPTPKPVPEKPKPAPAKAPAKSQSKPTPPAKAPAKTAAKATATPSKGTAAQSKGSKLKLDTSDWKESASRSTSTNSKASDGATASAIGPAQKSALDAEIRRQLKPHWKAPTGADVESLRTIVNVKLARDGSVVGTPEIVDTLGITASNRTQVRLHQEQAVKAIRLAAPFSLPAQFYSSWQFLQLTFDKRLSQ